MINFDNYIFVVTLMCLYLMIPFFTQKLIHKCNAVIFSKKAYWESLP
jgi:hypothetical protein